MTARSQNGFTLIELLLAMAIFSFGLLVVTAGTIVLLQMYRAGLGARSTQGTAQSALETISLAARGSQGISSDSVDIATPSDTLCLEGGGAGGNGSLTGDVIFYVDATNTLVRANWNRGSASLPNPCKAAFATSPPQAITATDDEVAAFEISPVPCQKGAAGCGYAQQYFPGAKITLLVKNRGAVTITSTGADGVLHTDCDPKDTSCSLATLSTTITARIINVQ